MQDKASAAARSNPSPPPPLPHFLSTHLRGVLQLRQALRADGLPRAGAARLRGAGGPRGVRLQQGCGLLQPGRQRSARALHAERLRGRGAGVVLREGALVCGWCGWCAAGLLACC